MKVGRNIVRKFSRSFAEDILYEHFNYGSSGEKVIKQLNQINEIYQEFKLKDSEDNYSNNKKIFDTIFGSLEQNIKSKGKVPMNAHSFIFFITFLYVIKLSNSKPIKFNSKKIIVREVYDIEQLVISFEENYPILKKTIEKEYNFVINEDGSVDEGKRPSELFEPVNVEYVSILVLFLTSVCAEEYEILSSEIDNLVDELRRIAQYKAVLLEDKKWICEKIRSLNNKCTNYLKRKKW